MRALLIKPNFPTLCWRSQGQRRGGFLGRYRPGLSASQPASQPAYQPASQPISQDSHPAGGILIKRGPGKLETLHQHPSLAPRIDSPLYKHLTLAPCTRTLYQQPLPAPSINTELAQVSIESTHIIVTSSLQAVSFTPPRTPPPSPTSPPGCRPLP